LSEIDIQHGAIDIVVLDATMHLHLMLVCEASHRSQDQRPVATFDVQSSNMRACRFGGLAIENWLMSFLDFAPCGSD
jgi:hypothetical protein